MIDMEREKIESVRTGYVLVCLVALPVDPGKVMLEGAAALHQSLSISIEHLPDGIGSVFFFPSSRMLIVK